jgi:hypothetical protein
MQVAVGVDVAHRQGEREFGLQHRWSRRRR